MQRALQSALFDSTCFMSMDSQLKTSKMRLRRYGGALVVRSTGSVAPRQSPLVRLCRRGVANIMAGDAQSSERSEGGPLIGRNKLKQLEVRLGTFSMHHCDVEGSLSSLQS